MSLRFRDKIVSFLSFREDWQGAINLSRIAPGEWRRQLHWLDRSGLSLPLISELHQRKGTGLLPPRMRAELQQRIEDNGRRMIRMFVAFSQVVGGFNARGLSYACVKGFSLFPDYLPSIDCRHQADFDFLVAEEDMERAEEVLGSLGYELIVRDASGERRFATLGAEAKGRNSYLYSCDQSYAVELHLKAWEPEEGGVALSLPVDLARDLEWHTLDGVSFPRLQPEYQLIYQLLHYFRHLSGTWPRLLWLYEIARFVEKHHSDAALWLRCRALWERDWKLQQICLLVLQLTQEIFRCPVPEGLLGGGGQWLECRLWASHFSRLAVYSDLPGNKVSLLFLKPFFEDMEDFHSYRFRRLFPFSNRHALDERIAAPVKRSLQYRLRNACYQATRAWHHLSADLQYLGIKPLWEALCWYCRRGGSKSRKSGCAVLEKT